MAFLDQPYADVLLRLPRLPFANAMRQDHASLARAKEEFFAQGTIPTFTYSQARHINVRAHQEAVARAQEAITRIALDHRLTTLYEALLQERAYRLEAIAGAQRSDDDAVTAATKKLFGLPGESSASFLTNLRRAPIVERGNASPRITSKQLTTYAKALFAAYDMHETDVRVTDRQSARITRDPKHTAVLHIPRDYARSAEETINMLTHEIEVHALRTYNGKKSGLHALYQGMPGYIATDEGLALFFEHKDGTVLTPGFWNALTASLSATTTFAETFATLAQAKRERAERSGDTAGAKNAADAAWNLCVRAYRGITHPNRPGLGYFRDHIYYSGFLAVARHIATHPDDLSMLFSGHCGLQHMNLLRDLNITPGATPRMLARSIVMQNEHPSA